jgi:hypothetical protein
VRFACLLVLGWYGGQFLKDSPSLTGLRYWMYRQQLKLDALGTTHPQKTVIVLLDDEDYWGPEFEGRTPLKRDVLAEILDKLWDAGVNTVAIDVDLRSPYRTKPDFDFPTYKDEDAKFLSAVGSMCSGRNVVLASSVIIENNQYVETPSVYSAAEGNLSCLHKGYIQLPRDLRRVPGTLPLWDGKELDSLSLATVKLINPTAYRDALDHPERGFRFSRYLSEADYQPRDGVTFLYNWHTLKDTDPITLRRELADKVVLIGGYWHTYAYGQGPRVDQFNSPVGAMAGVFLHANYIEALAGERGTFAPISDTIAELLELLLVLGFTYAGLLKIHAAWKWGAFFCTCILGVAITYVLIANLGIFMDFLVPILIIIGHTVVEEFVAMRLEIRHLKHHSGGAHQ